MDVQHARRLKAELGHRFADIQSRPGSRWSDLDYVRSADLETPGPYAAVGFGIGFGQHGYCAALRVWGSGGGLDDLAHELARPYGDKVDVRVTGPIRLLSGSAGPVRSGSSIRGSGGRGTVGLVLERTPGKPLLLTNAHVVGGTPSAIGTPVYGAQGQGEVGRVEVIEPLSWEGNLVDAAAVAAGNIRVDPTVRGHPVISGGPPTLGQEVEKRGASTGRTAGVVSAIELDGVTVSYGTSRLVFDDQIEIDTIEGVFSGQGDSGSAIITVESDAPPRVIGLLFAGPVWDDGTPSYANPIASVFAALGIDG